MQKFLLSPLGDHTKAMGGQSWGDTPQGVGRVRSGRAEVKRENGTQGVGQARDGNGRVHRVANFDKNQPKYLSFSSKIPKIFARAFGAWIIYFLIDL